LITPTVTHRATIIEPKAIGALMRAIDGYRGVSQVEAALKLLPLVFCRPGELRAAEWDEFDLNAAIWIISAGRTKTRRPHRVALSRQALLILRNLQPITGSSPLLFPSVRSWHRCISENTLNAALRRIGYREDQITAHGFRAMAATRLNEMLRWHPDVIERALIPESSRQASQGRLH
jgi:integrase